MVSNLTQALKLLNQWKWNADAVPSLDTAARSAIERYIRSKDSSIEFPLSQNGDWDYYWNYLDDNLLVDEAIAWRILLEEERWIALFESRQVPPFLVTIRSGTDILTDLYLLSLTGKRCVVFTHEVAFGPYLLQLYEPLLKE